MFAEMFSVEKIIAPNLNIFKHLCAKTQLSKKLSSNRSGHFLPECWELNIQY
jgi:hypothetical protein